MYKLKILSIGKTKEPWLKEALEEYTRRLQPILSIEWVLFKQDEELLQALSKEAHYIALSPEGKALSSESFSNWLLETLRIHDSRLSFAIGGAEGLPKVVTQRALATLSLSPLTFTHQLTRLILLEQLYRAFEISKGSQYHK